MVDEALKENQEAIKQKLETPMDRFNFIMTALSHYHIISVAELKQFAIDYNTLDKLNAEAEKIAARTSTLPSKLRSLISYVDNFVKTEIISADKLEV